MVPLFVCFLTLGASFRCGFCLLLLTQLFNGRYQLIFPQKFFVFRWIIRSQVGNLRTELIQEIARSV